MGAGLGAAVATPLGMNLHSRIAASIQDPIIRNEVLVPFTPEAVLEETVSNGLLYGIGAHVTERLADSFGQVVTKRGAVKMLVGGAEIPLSAVFLVVMLLKARLRLICDVCAMLRPLLKST